LLIFEAVADWIFQPITSPIIEATHAEAAPESSSGPNVDENGQIEIPFVPAAQRKPITELEMEGEIVVVGQRQKKRKRDRKAKVQIEDDSLPASTAPSPPPLPSPQAELEPFDYASAPNVLDEGAEFLDDGSGKKGKKRKLGKREARGAVFQYGDFPAPPRNPTDIRSGNKSYTYR
jgi:exosome complex exonuclease RRP6